MVLFLQFSCPISGASGQRVFGMALDQRFVSPNGAAGISVLLRFLASVEKLLDEHETRTRAFVS